MTSWVSRIFSSGVPQQAIQPNGMRPDRERLFKLWGDVKDLEMLVVGKALYVGETDYEDFEDLAAQPEGWTWKPIPVNHPCYVECRDHFRALAFSLLKLCEERPEGAPYGGSPYVPLATAFESLAHLTALLPRAGVADVAPLLAITHELGEWMQKAFEPSPPGRSVT